MVNEKPRRDARHPASVDLGRGRARTFASYCITTGFGGGKFCRSQGVRLRDLQALRSDAAGSLASGDTTGCWRFATANSIQFSAT
jgi:hypothetical protein